MRTKQRRHDLVMNEEITYLVKSRSIKLVGAEGRGHVISTHLVNDMTDCTAVIKEVLE